MWMSHFVLPADIPVWRLIDAERLPSGIEREEEGEKKSQRN